MELMKELIEEYTNLPKNNRDTLKIVEKYTNQFLKSLKELQAKVKTIKVTVTK
jgi:CHASE3 domain sensor protein